MTDAPLRQQWAQFGASAGGPRSTCWALVRGLTAMVRDLAAQGGQAVATNEGWTRDRLAGAAGRRGHTAEGEGG